MGEKFGSEREVKAVIHNIKEQRLLEKSLGTLDLEESYSVKLLNLDCKAVKIRQRRLKNKVNKIKSNLTPDEIADMKMKGIDDQIARQQAATPSNGAVRIAAAAKRLKLGMAPRETRYGVRRPSTALGTVSDASSRKNDDASRKNDDGGDTDSQLRAKLRPATSVGVGAAGHRGGAGPPLRPMTAPGANLAAELPTTDISDVIPNRRQVESARTRPRRASAWSASSFGGEQRRAKAAEKRQDLLEEIAGQQETERERCEEFMLKADRWVEENPSITYQRPDAHSERGDRSARHYKPGRDKDDKEDASPETGQPTDTAAMWRDLRKCRYLRIDDDQVDLSGVNTLAMDQLSMRRSYQNKSRPVPLKAQLDVK